MVNLRSYKLIEILSISVAYGGISTRETDIEGGQGKRRGSNSRGGAATNWERRAGAKT